MSRHDLGRFDVNNANDASRGADSNPEVVLHWAGLVTDEVFSFLGPISSSLARAGVAQTIVLNDEPRYAHLLSRFDPSIRLVLIPAAAGRCRRWKRARDAFVAALRADAPSIVHLHGFIPYLLRAGAVGRLTPQAKVLYSPHGSRALASGWGPFALLRWLGNHLFGATAAHDIANVSSEARALKASSKQRVTLVESAVAPVFFGVDRAEAEHPLVVTGNRIPDMRGAATFAQLAVLLSEESLGVRFDWIGRSDPLSESALKAANVKVSDVTDDAERARRFAAGWLYVAPQGKNGFPLFLAEAMAAGLACVAIDTDYHRDLIRHASTGYLCRNEEEMVARIAMLIDSPELRAVIGDAARREAIRRFSGQNFRDALVVSSA
jgi:glycosyltransferase involved in cell wall biosynthesis